MCMMGFVSSLLIYVMFYDFNYGIRDSCFGVYCMFITNIQIYLIINKKKKPMCFRKYELV